MPEIEYPPEDDPTVPVHTVPKWPFVLGDVILVAAAFVLWATQPELSERQLLFCLGAVAAGAFLFTVPYLLEHFSRSQEFPEPPANSTAAEQQRLAALEGDLRRQVRAATEALEQAARANAAFEGSARRFETRLAPLTEIQKKLEAVTAELREAGARPPSKDPHPLEREFARLREEHADKFKSAESKLAKLGEVLANVSAQIESLAARAPEQSRPQTETPPLEMRPEAAGSMLAKALATAQPANEAPAMADIIQSRPRRPRKPKPAESAETPASPEPPPVEPADPAAPMDAAPSEGWESLAEGKFDQVTSTLEAPLAPESAAVAVADPPTATPEQFVTETKTARAKAAALRDDDHDEDPSAASAQSDKPASEPAQGELLADAAETTRKRRSGKTAADTTSLVARVLIGIGNKPFVRGEGPGLSSSKGVPMEFVEIGKWQWVAPSAVKGPLKLQILKNDETPAKGESIELKPGQQLEVSPVFPA